MLTTEEISEIEGEAAHYPKREAVSIDALKIVQRHRGWVSDESLRDIAAHLGMSPGGFIGAPLCNGLTGRSRIPFSAGSLALPL